MITESWLKSVHGKPTDCVKEYADRDAMSVRVSPKGKVVFQLRYRFAGKAHRLDLGTYPQMSLKEARAKNHDMRVLLDQGKNPKIEIKMAQMRYEQADSLESLFNIWYQSYCSKQKLSHREIKRSFELHVFPLIGKLPAARITLQQWLAILEPLAQNKKGIAERVLVNAKQMLKWAIKRQMIEHNVLADIYGKEDLNIEKGRVNRVLSDDELVLLSAALEGSRMAQKNKLFVKLCLIYGCRNGELRRANIADIDFEQGVWTVPVENNKIRRKVNRPILRPILPETEILFKQLIVLSNSLTYLLTNDKDANQMGKGNGLPLPYNLMQWLRWHKGVEMPHWSLHDLRRTARTNFSAFTSADVAEIMVGHELKGERKTYDYYTYLPEQAEAYKKWIGKLLGIGFQL